MRVPTLEQLRAEKQRAVRDWKGRERWRWLGFMTIVVAPVGFFFVGRYVGHGEAYPTWQTWLGLGMLAALEVVGVWVRSNEWTSSHDQLAQDVAFCAAMDAASELDKGNVLSASILVDELLKSLPCFFRRKPIYIGSWRQNPELRQVLWLNSPRRYRRAISAAIQASGDRASEFSHHLKQMAESLSGKMDEPDYVTMQKSLQWLVAQSKEYGEPGLVEKYQDFMFVVNVAGLIVIPVLAAAVGAAVGILTRP
ncbi:MAG: hypothetical protein JW753_05585 [Dehalococcoidia bacterium]|nr:hypothetical protein [Dehalococcoidia bacterium]